MESEREIEISRRAEKKVVLNWISNMLKVNSDLDIHSHMSEMSKFITWIHICKCCEDGHCYSEAQTNSLEVMEIQFILAGGLNLLVALEEMELMWLCSCVILL